MGRLPGRRKCWKLVHLSVQPYGKGTVKKRYFRLRHQLLRGDTRNI